MAKLIGVCRDEDCHFGIRQLPLVVDDTLTLVMQFTDACVACNNNMMKNKDIEVFTQKYSMLTKEELSVALKASSKEIFSMLSQVVPCVGCRRSVERLFQQLVDCGHPAVEPLTVSSNDILTLNPVLKSDPKKLCTFFNAHGPRLNAVIDSIPKSKKNRRCLLHSLDLQRISRPMGSNWVEVWDLMSRECQEEVVIVETEMLLDTLDTYLRKHRFCTECKSKVMRAYNILIGEIDPNKEKGYLPALYYGIRSCPPERHVHVLGETQFLSYLIAKAEPELKGGYNLCGQRERHAKTIEIAQEEVLTCLGIYLYERLHRIWQRLQEMEQIWQILFHVGVDCLKKNFDLSIEEKRGYSQLELFCEEITKAEKAKELKKELKRQKKKKKKEIKAKLEHDEKENQMKLNNEKNESCCKRRNKSTDKLPEKFSKVIDVSSEFMHCSCDSECEIGLTCSECKRHHTVSSSSSDITSANVDSISSCTRFKHRHCQHCGSHSDSGYFSSYGNVNKCFSHDSSPTSEINSNEGDNHSCHSDQSLDSVSSEALSELCCKCEKQSCQRHNDDMHSSQRSLSSLNGNINRSLSCCKCAMCSCGKSCGNASTLQDMLHNSGPSDEEMFISAEDIQRFHAQQPQVVEKRRELRQALKLRFANFKSSAKNLNSIVSCKTFA